MQSIWKIKGFIPYVIILFLNATTDLAHKITIQNVLLKSFDSELLITLSAVVNALILLPFILLFSASGFLSDKYSKIKVIRYAAFASVPLALLITLCYYQGWFIASFVMTFLLALQSAIYSPAKYGVIKELVGTQNLGPANGVVQAVTIVAILFSTLLFSFIFELFFIKNLQEPNAIIAMIAPMGWILVGLTLLESFLTLKLPNIKAAQGAKNFNFKKYLRFGYFSENIRLAFSEKHLVMSIFGISLFWGAGQVLVAGFPAHYKIISGDDNALVVQGILALNAVGIVFGSLVAGKSSYHHIELGLVPVGAFGLSVALFMFTYASDISYLLVASLMFGFFGGLFVVPLNAMLQFFSKEDQMGGMMAANNFIQNLVMISLLVLSMIIVQFGLLSVDMFFMMAVLLLLASLYAVKKLPHLFVRLLLMPLLKSRYHLNVQGIQNLPQSGGVLLLGNHISWIDWLILQAASPRSIYFVMERDIYRKWYVYAVLRYFDIIPISQRASKDAMVRIGECLDEGSAVALFPEGGLSSDGTLQDFKKGFEHLLKGQTHPILPFYIEGLWGSRFSRSNSTFKKRKSWSYKREITVSFAPLLPPSSSVKRVEDVVRSLAKH